MPHRLRVAERPCPPETSGCLATYDQLRGLARAFAAGHFNLLILQSEPGIGKSRTFRDTLKELVDSYCLIDKATPFGAYVKCFQYRDKLVLIDEPETLIDQTGGKLFLKQLCNTEPRKLMQWQTRVTITSDGAIPNAYWTTSKVCIPTNKWNAKEDIHLQAVEDRGLFWRFEPTALEIHTWVASWFWDQEIFNYVGRHLPHLKRPTGRLYIKADELKGAGLDWRGWINQRLITPDSIESAIIELLNDSSIPSNNQRSQAFVRRKLGTRSTFYARLRDIEERIGLTSVPHIEVAGTKPTVPTTST